jgi:hypothetical protein
VTAIIDRPNDVTKEAIAVAVDRAPSADPSPLEAGPAGFNRADSDEVLWVTAVVPQGVQPPACPVWGQGDILVISAKSRVV